MKLHLTAESERGKQVTKTGNEYLDLIIRDDNREQIARLRVYKKKDDVGEFTDIIFNWAEHVYVNGQHGESAYVAGNSPRLKQFEPKCKHCKSSMTDTGDEYVCDNESCGYNLVKPIKSGSLKR